MSRTLKKILHAPAEDRTGDPSIYSLALYHIAISRPKAVLLFWFFGDFRCGALLFMIIHVISSPEHEVLMVSYCDQSMSVVRRASCVVNNLF